MLYLATFFYLASLVFQTLAFWFALISFGRAGQHRYGWLFFSLGLLLMLGRRVSPVMAMWQSSHINMTDAVLSVPISFLLMLGVLSLRKVLGELDDKTRALLHAQNLDVLTSALNRAALFAEGEKEIERSLRMRHSFAVLMLDIDHFKNINDRCGHLR